MLSVGCPLLPLSSCPALTFRSPFSSLPPFPPLPPSSPLISLLS
ncbi:hypothetical protein OMAG_000954 [Candidatus Omnitrophus magneticus]|uniref:Uncharacterized protein n=1 Tax=Candidatus Omnitrophus magneticus TaxID=1609969 RepID=A0A0F0CUH8_9BACT|nr:hypothetical protein OMAG_000954 [Candidatus Omnitrophus magneticus]